MKKLTLLLLFTLLITLFLAAQTSKEITKDNHAEKEWQQENENEREQRLSEIRKKYKERWEKQFEERHKITLKSGASTVAVDKNDSLALVALYNSTNGPNWRNEFNWLEGPVNTWKGVELCEDGKSYRNKNMGDWIKRINSI